ncbi:hypothetical protein HDU93_004950 [Gonapodya sp. JEL0774]|nr:hypothetical protein HDU93_004950 [Gonapodya sp. JEL0774]
MPPRATRKSPAAKKRAEVVSEPESVEEENEETDDQPITRKGTRAAKRKTDDAAVPEKGKRRKIDDTKENAEPTSDSDVSPSAKTDAVKSPAETTSNTKRQPKGKEAAASKSKPAPNPRTNGTTSPPSSRPRRNAASQKTSQEEPDPDNEEDEAEEGHDDEPESDFEEPTAAKGKGQARTNKAGKAKADDEEVDPDAVVAEDSDASSSPPSPAHPRRATRGAAASSSSALAPAPAAKRRAPAKKSTKPSAADDDDSLFDVVVEGKASLDAVAAEWAAGKYARDREGAVGELVDLIMQAAGYPPNSISRDVLENPDEHDVGEEVEEAGRRAEGNALFNPHDPPLTSRKPRFALRSKAAQSTWAGNRFSKSYREWWVRWVGRVRAGVVKKPAEGEEDGEGSSDPETWAWEVIKIWTHQLSTSPVRTLRHAATAAGLGIMGGLVEATRSTVDAESAARRQLEAAGSAKGAGARKKEALEERVRELEGERAKLEEEMMAFFDGIFVHRYRDVDPIIRGDCSRELGAAVLRLPEVFLDPMYLRYTGWALSDKNAAVRLEPLHTLHRLLNHPQASSLYVPGLRQFFERFRPRLLDLGRGDIDPRCREEGVRVCVAAANHGFMDEEDAVEALVPMVVGRDKEVAAMVGAFVVKIVEDESEELAGQVGADTDEKKRAVQIKVMCQIFAKACETATRREMAPVVGSGGGGSSQSQSQSGSSQIADSLIGQQPDLFGVSWNIGDDGLEAVRWLKEEAGGFASGEVSAPRIKMAVEAVWDDLEVLRVSTNRFANCRIDVTGSVPKDFNGLCDHLSEEPTTGQARARNPLVLTPTEETVLVHILPAVLDVLLAVEDDGEKRDQVRKDASRHLVRSLPKILSKYSPDFSGDENSRRLEQVVTLLNRLDTSTYVDLRMTKAFESLISDLYRIFTQHEDMNVLREIATSLRRLLSRDDPPADAKSSAKRRKVQLVADSPDAGLAAVTRRKVEDLVEELFSSLSSSLEEISNALNEGDLELQTALDVASPARFAIKRLSALISAIDFGSNQFEADTGDELSDKVRLAYETLSALRTKAAELPTRNAKGKQVVRPGKAKVETGENEHLKNLHQVIDEGLDACIRTLSWDVMWVGSGLMKAGLSSRGLEDIESDDREGPSTPRKKVAPQDPVLEEGKKKLRDRVEVLYGVVTSALNVNVADEADIPSFGVRCTASRVLGDLSFLLDGDLGALVSSAADVVFPLSDEVQEGLAAVIGLLVEIASGLLPKSRGVDRTFDFTMEDDLEVDPGENPIRCPFERHLVPAVARQLELVVAIPIKLLAYDRLEAKFAPHLLKWVGVATECTKVLQAGNTPASAPPQVLEPFFWDTVVGQSLCKHLISDLGRAALAGQVDSLSEKARGKLNASETPAQRQGRSTRLALDSLLTDFILESMDESLEFYFSGRLPSIDHAIHLARSVSTEMKTWAPIFARAPGHRREAALEACVGFLRKASELMANRIHDCVRSSNRVASRLRGSKNLGDACQGWKPWAVVAAGVAVVLGIAGKEGNEGGESRERGRVLDRIRDGVLSELQNTLSAHQLKPTKSSDWDGYHAFVAALEGSTAEEKKIRKGKKPASNARAVKAAGAKPRKPRATKVKSEKSRAKPLQFASALLDDEDEDSDAGVPAKSPKSRRRYATEADEDIEDDEEVGVLAPRAVTRQSARSSVPRKSFREDSEEEDGESEEEAPPPRATARSRPPPMRLLEEDDDEPAGGEEEEEEILDPSALLAEARQKRAGNVYGKGSGSSSGRGTKRKPVVDNEQSGANGYDSDGSQGEFVDDRAIAPTKKKRIT